ncbi:MAG: hypothetical protein WCO71_09005 [Pseudomonadota bacterium]
MRILTLLASLTFFSAQGFAAEDPSGQGDVSQHKKVSAVAQPKRARMDETPTGHGRSRDNREGKTFIVAAGVQLIEFLHFGTGLKAGIYLDEDSLLELNYATGTFGFLGSDSKYTFVTADFHHFVGNSFYLFAGAGIRDYEEKNDSFGFIKSSSLPDRKTTFSRRSSVAELGLGNRWQFDTFTLGCDWISYSAPLATMSSKSKYEGEFTDSEKSREQSDFNSHASRGTFTAVRFYLGVSL